MAPTPPRQAYPSSTFSEKIRNSNFCFDKPADTGRGDPPVWTDYVPTKVAIVAGGDQESGKERKAFYGFLPEIGRGVDPIGEFSAQGDITSE